ncbi:MAG: hypothetical protein EP332_05235 [Bacteroidetes bacterium]|nr:MAG: hypothetical protein EP332_05235 [Bacteroidota bacterium]
MKSLYSLLLSAALLAASCQSSENKSDSKTITGITVLKGTDTIALAKEYSDAFLSDFKTAKEVGPLKFMGTHLLHVQYADGSHDVLKSNGTAHSGEGRYLRNEFNIIDRYRQYGELDTISGQLHTVAELQVVLKTAEIDKAPEFFSTRIQEKLFQIAEKGGNLGEWAAAWNLDSAAFAKYKRRIIEGRGAFLFENGAWRINEL